MEHIWSVICQSYIVDRESGNLSLVGIPSRLGFRGDVPDERPFELPLQPPFFLVTLWRTDTDTIGVTESALVKVRAPNGDVIGTFDVLVEFGDTEGHQTYGKLETVLYQQNGVHRFEVYLYKDGDWSADPVASIPLEIVHEQPVLETEESEPTD